MILGSRLLRLAGWGGMRTMRAMNVRLVTWSAMSSRVLRFMVACLVNVLALAHGLAFAADLAPDTNVVWLAEHYTKYEHCIPMRDGVRLFTRVYIPKDDAQAWPIVLTRTSYALK